MSDRNTVTVKIYGQEYSISAELPREYIMKLADFVDSKMHETAAGSNLPISSVAVLTAVGMANDYFTVQKDADQLIDENARITQESGQYVQMWEEVKRSFAQYKADMASAVAERDNLRASSAEKDKQLADLFREVSEAKKYNEVLRSRVEELSTRADAAEAAPAEAQKRISELEAKCRDTESSFFDIQMENLQLRNELDLVRKQLGR